MINLYQKIKNSPIGNRLARGTYWSFVAELILRVIFLISSVIVARLIGREDFGRLGVVQNTVGMFGAFASFGLGITATKYVAEYRIKDPQKTGRIITLSCIIAFLTSGSIALLLYIFSPWLSNSTLSDPSLVILLKISAVTLFFTAINGAQIGVLTGFEDFRTIAKINFISGAFGFPILIFLVHKLGLHGAVIAGSINIVFTYFLNNFVLRRRLIKNNISMTLLNIKNEFEILVNFSLPAALGGLLVGPVNWACTAILVNQINGYTEMGLFNVANQWRLAMLIIPNVLFTSFFPILCNERSNNITFGKILESLQKSVFIIIFPVFILLISTEKIILNFYGSQYSDASNAFLFCLASASIYAIGFPAGALIQINARMWLGLIMNFSQGLVFVLLTFYFSKLSGASGLAYSNFVSYVFLAVWGNFYMRNEMPNRIFVRTILGILFIVSITGAIYYIKL